MRLELAIFLNSEFIWACAASFRLCLRSRSSMKVGMKLFKQSISTFSEQDGDKTMTISGIQVLIV